MKKIKRMFSLLLCGMLALFSTACDFSIPLGNKEEKESSYVQLENFDSYKTVTKIFCDKSIGDGSVSKDYASEGEGSFRVQVAPASEANKDQKRSTYFYVPMRRDTGSYIDFSMVDQVSLDVYGLEGTDLSVSIALALRGKSTVMGPAETFEVKNGEWTTVYFNVNRTVTNALLDITKISDIRISCAGVNAVICVDNLQIHKASTEFVQAEVSLEENEFCDFEKSYQSFMVTTKEASGVTPSVEVVTDPNWATSGARSLRVTAPKLSSSSYYFLMFSTTLCSASGIINYPDTDYFVFDVYKPFETTWSLTVRFVNKENAYTNNKVIVPEGLGWHTICIPLTQRVTKTTSVQFSWNGSNKNFVGANGETLAFYIDNMRYASELPTKGSVFVFEETEE